MAEFRLPPYRVTPTVSQLSEAVDWGFADVPTLWEQTQGEGVKVAILDNGCDVDHPDLQGQVDETKDFTGRGFVAGDHGTPVASLIAGKKDGRGMIGGAPKARLAIGQVLFGISGVVAWMIDGIYWATDEVNADIINISAGFPVADGAVMRAVNYAMEKGKMFAVAAGNDGRSNSVNFPARWTGGIAAFNSRKQLSRFSSRGPEILCACPGEGVTAATPGGGYGLHDGTSFACPTFCAFAALAIAKHKLHGGSTPLANQKQLREHVAEACEDAGDRGFDEGFGYGILMPKALVGKPAEKPVDPMAPVRDLILSLPSRYELWRRRA